MALNTATLLMRLSTDLTAPTPRDWRTDTLNRKLELLNKLREQSESFSEKEKTILASRVLSDEGKRDELKKLATERLASFAWLGRVCTEMDANVERLEATLFDVTSPETNEIKALFRAMEVWRTYRTAAEPQRTVAFLTACEQDREEVLAAMLDDPLGPMVSDDVVDRGLTARAKRIRPTEYATYQQVELLRDFMAAYRDHVALWLRGYTLDPQKIHDVLGGTVQSYVGLPDGSAPLRGAEWAQAVAAGA